MESNSGTENSKKPPEDDNHAPPEINRSGESNLTSSNGNIRNSLEAPYQDGVRSVSVSPVPPSTPVPNGSMQSVASSRPARGGSLRGSLHRSINALRQTSRQDSVSSMESSKQRTPHGSPVKSLIGSIMRQISGSSVPLSRQASRYSSTPSSQWVIVTESTSIIPNLASTASLHAGLPSDIEWEKPKPFGDINKEAVSVSVQQLEKPDIYDDPEYVDTVKSTDSAGSLLRRTFSVPPDYSYHPYEKDKHPHVREIFANILPNGKRISKESLDKHRLSEDSLYNRQTSQESLQSEIDEIQHLIRAKEKGQFKKTLEDLLEQPEYADTAESSSSRTALLAQVARAIASGDFEAAELPPQVFEEIKEEEERMMVDKDDEFFLKQEKKRYFKNLMVLSFSFLLVFTSYLSLRNLQSSLNHQAGLGLYALSCVYASLFIGCMFATSIVQKLRAKRTMVLLLNGFLLYVVSNFYPSFYTLLPSSAIVGFCLAGSWTAHATYLTNIAIRYAELNKEKIPIVISRFNGIFFSIFQCSQIVGGIISSLILMKSPVHHMDNTNNTEEIEMINAQMDNLSYDLGLKDVSFCGAKYCHINAVTNFSVDVDRKMVYLLVAIYTAFALLGVLLLVFCLDPLEGMMKKSTDSMKDQFLSVFRFFLQWKAICLLFLMFYSLMQMSFMFGEYTKAFVTCASGVHLVGYAMLCMSACGAISSFVNGRLQKYVGQLSLILFAAAVHLSLYIVMLIWKPTPDSIPVMFLISGVWGIADGIFLTQTISVFGTLFFENKEPAFAALKMCQAVGAFSLFVSSPYMCTSVKIYMLMVVLILAVIGYVTLHFRLKKIQANTHLAVPVVKV